MTAGARHTAARVKALPAASRDTLLAAVVAVLAFTPGIADKGTSLG